MADPRLMLEVPAESVHLIVTSPPSWRCSVDENALRTTLYDNYEEYVNNLNMVWNECRRVLYDGCRLCIHIGDQFAKVATFGRYKIIPIRTEIIRFCETVGFDYMGAIICHKVKPGEKIGPSATMIGSYLYPRNGVIKIDYQFVLVFKKPGNSPVVSREQKEQSRLSVEEWNEYFSGHWQFPVEKRHRDGSLLTEELHGRLIRMFSFVGETVLDPFWGSGGTSLAAKRLQRNSIGYEMDSAVFPLIRKKLGVEQADIFSQDLVDVIKPRRDEIDFEKERQKLPYLFYDPFRNRRVNDKE